VRTRICFTSLLVLALAGCNPDNTTPASSQNPTDPTLKTLQDLGVTPERMVELAKEDLARKQALAAAGQPAPAETTDPVSAAATAAASIPQPQPADLTQAPPAAPQPPAAQQPGVAMPQPIVESLPLAEAGPVPETAVAQQPAVVVQQAQDFYAPLAPYGTWVDMPDYGRVWQPSVTLIDTAWRPYCQGGHWISTDCGWYWQADYTWGWAPFHYGRWCYINRYRWVWLPDTVWAPAWVSWRRSDSYCGWAPLPPAARFRAGVGLEFGGDAQFDVHFGLSARNYTFVSAAHFGDRNIFAVALAADRVEAVYRGSAFVVGAVAWDEHDRRVHLTGPDHDWIARETHQPFRPVRIVAPQPPVHPAGALRDNRAPAARRNEPAAALPAAVHSGAPAFTPSGAGNPRVEPMHPAAAPAAAAHLSWSSGTPAQPVDRPSPPQTTPAARHEAPLAPAVAPAARATPFEHPAASGRLLAPAAGTPPAAAPTPAMSAPARIEPLRGEPAHAEPARIEPAAAAAPAAHFGNSRMTTRVETPVPGISRSEEAPSPRSAASNREATPAAPVVEHTFSSGRPVEQPSAPSVQPQSFHATHTENHVAPAAAASQPPGITVPQTPQGQNQGTPDGRGRDRDRDREQNPGGLSR